MAEYIDRSYVGTGIYREHILDHYKNPRNRGSIKNPDIHHKEYNPLCGDEVEMDINFKDGKISEIRFSGYGCAISQASSSMLTEHAKGKDVGEIKKMQKEDMFDLLGIKLSPVRIKCAVLCLDTLKNAVYMHEKYKK